MAQFPIAEAEIVELAAAMVAGLTAHPADFSSTDPAAIDAAKEAYENAKTAQTDALAASRIATTAKNDALKALEKVMKLQLAKSQIDVTDEPIKLSLIGWGPKQQATPVEPPTQPRNFEATLQGPGNIVLKWKRSSEPGGPVRDYIIERRDNSTGGDLFGEWTLVATVLERQVELFEQPRGIQMEYRVKARNLGGQSEASNTMTVVL